MPRGHTHCNPRFGSSRTQHYIRRPKRNERRRPHRGGCAGVRMVLDRVLLTALRLASKGVPRMKDSTMKTVHIIVSIAIAASLAASACDKSEGNGASATATATAATTATSTPQAMPAASATTAPQRPRPSRPYRAAARLKAGARVLGCTEYYGELPDGVEASCKKDDGTFASGATPCSTNNAIGSCAHAGTATASQIEVSYKTSVGDAKGSCEILGNTWTPMGGGREVAEGFT